MQNTHHGYRNRHYFYKLKGEHAVVSTPKGGWFRSKPSSSQSQVTEEVPRSGHYPSSLPKVSVKKPKKQIILSQSMVIDMDPNKVRSIDSGQRSLGTFFSRAPTEKRPGRNCDTAS